MSSKSPLSAAKSSALSADGGRKRAAAHGREGNGKNGNGKAQKTAFSERDKKTLRDLVSLADRIVAAAQRSPRIVRLPSARSAETTPGKATAPAEAVSTHPTVRQLPATALNAGLAKPWQVLGRPMAAGVLAASLVLGVLIGNLSTVSPQLLPAFAEVIGFTDRDDLVRIALSEEVML